MTPLIMPDNVIMKSLTKQTAMSLIENSFILSLLLRNRWQYDIWWYFFGALLRYFLLFRRNWCGRNDCFNCWWVIYTWSIYVSWVFLIFLLSLRVFFLSFSFIGDWRMDFITGIVIRGTVRWLIVSVWCCRLILIIWCNTVVIFIM